MSTLRSVNPSDTREVVGEFEPDSRTDVQQVVNAAVNAFPSWARQTPPQRAEVLDRAGRALQSRVDEIGTLLAREEGKTLPEAKGEVGRAGQILRYFAAEAVRLQGECGESTRPNVEVAVTREAVGVFALVTPWNFPIAIPAWKLAPALAFGNCAVLKPSEYTPATAQLLAEVLHEAGLPEGVLGVVNGPGATTGQALIDADGIDGISFTGSQATGRHIAVAAAARLRRLQLEMGGKNPLVVLDDADLETAVACALDGAFYSTGQRCTASSRLIVTDGIHDRFVALLETKMKALSVGHVLRAETQIGPVIHEQQLQQNQRYLAIARDEGVERVVGGERLERDTPGWFMAPALLIGSSNDQRINREEIFGPVAAVIRAGGFDEALHLANDTDFGLCAGICTTSLRHASHFRRHADAGLVMINLPTAGLDHHLPFGGRKGSSYGPREQGSAAREFYTQGKTAYTAA